MVRLEGPEEASVVMAQLEIGVLDQVIEQLPGGIRPAARGAKHCDGDHGVKAANELPPRFRLSDPAHALTRSSEDNEE